MRSIPLPDTIDVPIPYIIDRQIEWSTSFGDGLAYLTKSPIAWVAMIVVGLVIYRVLRAWFRWARMARALVATAVSVSTLLGYAGVTTATGGGVGVQPFAWSVGKPIVKRIVNEPALENRVLTVAQQKYGDTVFDGKGNFKKGCTLKTIDSVGQQNGVAKSLRVAAYCNGAKVLPKT